VTADERVRAFVALELEAGVREAIGALQARFAGLAGLRLVRPEGVHLTLRFLGASTAKQLATVAERLASAAPACPPFAARIGGLGTFPERGAPRVLWLGVELPAPALELQRACERAARAAGFEKEDRPFAPHLTLGRWRERAPRPSLPPAELGPARVEALVLFRSQTRPDGAVYTPLQRFTLGASG